MFWGQKTRKSFLVVGFGFILSIGTYNAVVINSQSTISGHDVKFVKRLDEMYGVVTPGRMVAATTTWKKLNKDEVKANPIVQVVKRIDAVDRAVMEGAQAEAATAAVQEDLELTLIEVINPKKWQQALASSDFAGNLSTKQGVIESLSVSLPGEENISISFSQMEGNVFEYDLDGDVFAGMIYQVDKSSYMITLTNGPLEGTRLRFSQSGIEETVSEAQESLAKNHQLESGEFGTTSAQVSPDFQPDQISRYDQAIQEEGVQAQSFNFEQSPI
jgi:hypothetical protein